MTQLTNVEYRTQTTNLFPTNGIGAISASDIRAHFNNTADSLPFKITGQTTAPTANDDVNNTGGNGAFEIGDLWIDETNDAAYICLDNALSAAIWSTIATLGGSVNVSGTPVNNQLAVWAAADTIEGDANLTWDGTTLSVTGNLTISGTLTGAGDVNKVGTPADSQIGVWTGDGTIEGTNNFTWNESTATLDLGGAVPRIRLTDSDLLGFHDIYTNNANLIIEADPGNVDASSDIQFNVDGIEVARFTSSALLDLTGNIRATDPFPAITFVDNAAVNPSTQARIYSDVNGSLILDADNNNVGDSGTAICFEIDTVEVARFDNSSNLTVQGNVVYNVGIGTETASFTLALDDQGTIREIDSALGAVTITIPTNASVAFPVGTIINFTTIDATNTITLDAAVGVTLNGVSGGQGDFNGTLYEGVTLYKRATDEWVVQGAIGAIA